MKYTKRLLFSVPSLVLMRITDQSFWFEIFHSNHQYGLFLKTTPLDQAFVFHIFFSTLDVIMSKEFGRIHCIRKRVMPEM